MKNSINISICIISFFSILSSVSAQEVNLVLRANSNSITIKEDNTVRKNIWEASPNVKLDEFVTNKFIGEKTVVFYSDIDSISFKVEPNKNYDFAVLIKEKDTAYTRISTYLNKTPSLRLPVEYYNRNNPNSLKDTIPFQIGKDNRIYIKGSVNDSEPIDFLFDTGADANVIKSSIVGSKVKLKIDSKIENIGTDGVSQVETSSANKLVFNDLVWYDAKILSINYKRAPFEGVLGWTAFEKKIIEIDYDTKLLIIHNKIENIAQEYKKIRMRIIEGLPYLQCTINVNGNEFTDWVEFDTGKSSNLNLSKEFSNIYGLENSMKLIGTGNLSGSAGIKRKINAYQLPRLSIGGYEFYNVSITILEQDVQGVTRNDILGNNILKRFNVILDFKNLYIYLKPNQLMYTPF